MLRSILEAVADRVVPATLSKATLTELCHTLEDQLLHEDLEGTVVAGFQRARYWQVERDRYAQLCADPKRRALVFAADESPDAPSGVTYVAVGEDHPLAREWFVVALTDRFSAVLFGRELTTPQDALERERSFLSVWSFDPIVVSELLTLLERVVDDLGAEVAAALTGAVDRHPPRRPAMGAMPRFGNAVFERLEAESARLRRESDELRQENEALQHRAEPAVPSASDAPPVPRPAHSGRALIVDDEPAIRGLLEALLRRAGWDVRTAKSLTSAARKLLDRDVEVLLIDEGLLDGGALEALGPLEAVRPGVASRTVLLSSEPPTDRELHGRPVARKPFVWAELERAIALVATPPRSAL